MRKFPRVLGGAIACAALAYPTAWSAPGIAEAQTTANGAAAAGGTASADAAGPAITRPDGAAPADPVAAAPASLPAAPAADAAAAPDAAAAATPPAAASDATAPTPPLDLPATDGLAGAPPAASGSGGALSGLPSTGAVTDALPETPLTGGGSSLLSGLPSTGAVTDALPSTPLTGGGSLLSGLPSTGAVTGALPSTPLTGGDDGEKLPLDLADLGDLGRGASDGEATRIPLDIQAGEGGGTSMCVTLDLPLPNGGVTENLPLVSGLTSSLPGLGGAAAAQPAGEASAFSCRASALRVRLGETVIEPIVANGADAPCVADGSGLVDTIDLGELGTIRAAYAETGTESEETPAGAEAGIVKLRLDVLGTAVSADVLVARAGASCAEGAPELTGSATVANLVVAGTPVEVPPDGTSQVVPLEGAGGLTGGTITVNETESEPDRVTRRALRIDLGAVEIVVAEATANVEGECSGEPAGTPTPGAEGTPTPGAEGTPTPKPTCPNAPTGTCGQS